MARRKPEKNQTTAVHRATPPSPDPHAGYVYKTGTLSFQYLVWEAAAFREHFVGAKLGARPLGPCFGGGVLPTNPKKPPGGSSRFLSFGRLFSRLCWSALRGLGPLEHPLQKNGVSAGFLCACSSGAVPAPLTYLTGTHSSLSRHSQRQTPACFPEKRVPKLLLFFLWKCARFCLPQARLQVFMGVRTTRGRALALRWSARTGNKFRASRTRLYPFPVRRRHGQAYIARERRKLALGFPFGTRASVRIAASRRPALPRQAPEFRQGCHLRGRKPTAKSTP